MLREDCDVETNPPTGVFWDVSEFPFPDIPPKNVYEKIKTCLVDNGYTGNLTICAYVNKQHLPDRLVQEFEETGINFLEEVPDDRQRSKWMVMDILLWAVDNPVHPPIRPNVIVLSVRISKLTDLVTPLDCLGCRGYNVLLAAPRDLPPSFKLATSTSSEWLAKALKVEEMPMDQDVGNPIDQAESSQCVDRKRKGRPDSDSDS